MSLKAFLAELRHRGVFKVAAAYLGIGALLLEIVSPLLHNFEAPHWVAKVFSTLVILGFPLACLMAWGFEFTPQGVHTASASESPPAQRRADAVFAVILVVIFGLVTASAAHHWRTPAPEAAAPAGETAAAQKAAPRQQAPAAAASVVDPSAPPSIAVLPFADMSPEHDQQYLGDGIAEELLNALASIGGLNVAARTSSFSFAGRGASIKEIGDTLHVRHVLEGSVRRSGQRLRVTAQLIDVETGFHLFSQSYDREVKDVFDIQNEIAREIITALMPRLGLSKDVALIKQGTSNLEAYNLRLKAHPALMNPAPGTLGPAVQQLRQAITLDPRYSDAWGDLSYAYAYMANWATDPVPLLVNATNAAAVALSDSPTNVMGLLTQGAASVIVHHDYKASAGYFERARAAGGDFSIWAFQKAYIHDGPLGHYDEAIAMLKEAERTDPLAPNLRWALIEMYLASGRVTEAVETAKEFQRLGSRAPGGIMLCGLAYLAAGDLQSARESLGLLRAAFGDEFPVTMILRFAIYGATKDRAGAQRLLDHLLSQYAEGQSVQPYIVGEGYRALGDYGRAIDWWARAVDGHYTFAFTFMPVRNRNDPTIGRDPRFLALLKRMGLDAKPASPAGSR